jgi:hypothetical protein
VGLNVKAAAVSAAAPLTLGVRLWNDSPYGLTWILPLSIGGTIGGTNVLQSIPDSGGRKKSTLDIALVDVRGNSAVHPSRP